MSNRLYFNYLRKDKPLYWWRPNVPHRHGIHSNFGDELNPYLYRLLTDKQPRQAKATAKNKVLAIGSILANAQAGDVVWGSGLNGKVRDESGQIRLPPSPSAIAFNAVRGPLTRNLLVEAGANVPETYGDPSLLLRLFHPPNPERRGTLVIPHFSDLAGTLAHWSHPRETVVWNVDSGVEATLAAINSAALVVTSALHGIILAEALGVPVVPFTLSNEEAPFKFEDYFLGTGRSMPRFEEGIEAALHATPPPPASLPNTLLAGLLRSCPFPLSAASRNLITSLEGGE